MKSGLKLFIKPACLAVLVAVSVLLVSTASFATTELRILTVWGGERKTHLDRVFKEYQGTHPGIKISHEICAGTGAGTYQEVLQVAIGSGTAPDIFFEWGGELAGFFIDARTVEPMERYWEKYNWDEMILPWAKQLITRNGKVWGCPHALQGMSFWYRVDLWNKLGLSEPQSYEEVETLCEKTKAAGIYPLSLAGKYGWMTMRLLDYLIEVRCGPELHDKLVSLETNWDRPEVVKAYQTFKKWVDQWIVPGFLPLSPDDARMPMYGGKALMVFEGNWMETVFKADGQDVHNFDFFIHPTDHKPLRVAGFPEQFMISASSKHKDEAAELINWLVQPELMNREYGKAFASTATIGVAPDKEELPSSYKWRKALEYVGIWKLTDQALKSELLHTFFELQDKIVLGEITPEQAVKRMQKAVIEWKSKEE